MHLGYRSSKSFPHLAYFILLLLNYLSENSCYYVLINRHHFIRSAVSRLRTLRMEDNKITTLPRLSSNTNLNFIDFSKNNIASEMPSDYFSSFAYLATLRMSENNITGTLPSLSRASGTLQVLDLAHNSFFGAIPSFAEFSVLTELNLAANSLSSDLSKLSLPPSLRYLDISKNKLFGGFPSFSSLVSQNTHSYHQF
jgi:Leucine-rich repeat (LRR) protein